MNGKNWLLMLVLAWGITSSALAQPDRRTPQAQRELRKELAQYQKQQVLPVLLEKRKAFDKKLSKADRRELADIRTKVQQHRQEQTQRFQQLRANRKDGQTISPEQKEAFRAAHLANRQQLTRLTEIARKYEKHLLALKQELQPLQTQWATDLQAIAMQHGVTAQNLQRKRGPRTNYLRNQVRWNTSRFLLMDPTRASTTPTPAEKGKGIGLQISPNPVTGQATLSFSLPAEGSVQLELVDQQGQVVQQAISKTYGAGPQQETLNLQALQNGVYFYRVTTAAGTQTVRFLKQ